MLRTAMAAVLVVSLCACRAPDEVAVEAGAAATAERLPPIAHAADPLAAGQLKEGFYGLEEDAWRWTAGRFVVALGIPGGAAGNGAVLSLRFSLPEAVVKRLGPVTLWASVAGIDLEPQTYTRPGSYLYERRVPAAALAGDTATVKFCTDKAIPPSETDRRELALIFISAALQPAPACD